MKKIIALLLAAVMLLALCACGSAPAATATPTPEPEPTPEPIPTKEELLEQATIFPLSDYFQLLDENKLKAEDNYLNNVYKTGGRVVGISEEGCILKRTTLDGFHHNPYIFLPLERSELVELTKGDYITIVGKLSKVGVLSSFHSITSSISDYWPNSLDYLFYFENAYCVENRGPSIQWIGKIDSRRRDINGAVYDFKCLQTGENYDGAYEYTANPNPIYLKIVSFKSGTDVSKYKGKKIRITGIYGKIPEDQTYSGLTEAEVIEIID